MNRFMTKCGASAIVIGLAWFAPATATASPEHSASTGAAATGNLGCEISLDDDAALVAAAQKAESVFVGVVDKRPDRKRGDGSPKKSSRSEPADQAGAPASNVVTPTAGWQHTVTVETNLDSIYQDGSPVPVTVTDAPGPQKQKPRLEKGARYLFLASSEGNRLMASTCQVIKLPDGQAAFNAAVQHLSELLGQKKVVPQKPQLTLADGATENPPEWGRIAAPGGALALVGLLGLVLALRLGRERR